ncbi:MAG: hypothetical protein ACLTDR_03415 [Adlercreutzia equolifaciens]
MVYTLTRQIAQTAVASSSPMIFHETRSKLDVLVVVADLGLRGRE